MHQVPASERSQVVLTEAFNQDPLEQLFGHCRHQQGSNSDPSVYQAQHSVNQLRVMGSTAIAGISGNTKRLGKPNIVVDNSPIPRRKPHKKD